MQTIDISLTIKNVPKEDYEQVMRKTQEELVKMLGKRVEPTNDMVIDFTAALKVSPRAALELISRMQSMYFTITAVKDIIE